MSDRDNRPVKSRDYWMVALVALFWILILWALTATFNIPLGSG